MANKTKKQKSNPVEDIVQLPLGLNFEPEYLHQDHKQRSVVLSNKMILSSFHLTEWEHRILILAIMNMQTEAKSSDEDSESLQTRFSVSQMASLIGDDNETTRRSIGRAIESLFDKKFYYLEQRLSDDGKVTLEQRDTAVHWITKVQRVVGSAIYILHWNPEVLPFLTKLSEHFTKLKLVDYITLPSKWSMRLYQIVMLHKFKGNFEITLNELRILLQPGNGYSRDADFYNKVILQAVNEINDHVRIITTHCSRVKRPHDITGRLTNSTVKFSIIATPEVAIEARRPDSNSEQAEQAEQAGELKAKKAQIIEAWQPSETAYQALLGEGIAQSSILASLRNFVDYYTDKPRSLTDGKFKVWARKDWQKQSESQRKAMMQQRVHDIFDTNW